MTTPPATLPGMTHREVLINDFTISPVSLGDLARAHRMTIPALAKWAGAPINKRMLEAIRDLSDTRTDLIVSHARTEAAHHLRRLASESDSAETQRKACVDLLRLGIAPAPAKGRGAKEPASAASADAAADGNAARRLLEALTAHDARAEADDDDAPETDRAEHAA